MVCRVEEAILKQRAGEFTAAGLSRARPFCFHLSLVMSSESLALSEVEWLETSLDVVTSPICWIPSKTIESIDEG